MKTKRIISEPYIPAEVWNEIKVCKINYASLTEDEKRFMKAVKKAEAKYFREIK